MEAPQVHLRPVGEHDLEQLELLDTDPTLTEPFEWRGFRDQQRHRRRWELDGYLGDRDSLLVVAVDGGEFAGIVSWRIVAPAGRSSAIEIGIIVLPEHRGHGVGTIAQRLLADYLFEKTPVHRLEATTEAENLAEQASLEKAGFVREGVLRGRGFVRGAWRDGLMYSRLRTDPDPGGGTS